MEIEEYILSILSVDHTLFIVTVKDTCKALLLQVPLTNLIDFWNICINVSCMQNTFSMGI